MAIGCGAIPAADTNLVASPAGVISEGIISSPPEPAVDIAPFARVLAWDPKVMEGTRALRSDEFPAEDIAPYSELLPAPDGTFAVPVTDDTGCIGLQWEENRQLQSVSLQFSDAVDRPAKETIELQYWTGESPWQGKWQPVEIPPQNQEDRLTWCFGEQETKNGTPKVRWVFAGLKQPIQLKEISAFSHSQWQTVAVRIETASPGSAKPAAIEIYNGVFRNLAQEPSCHTVWDGVNPLCLQVQASVARPYKADRTVLRFQMPEAAFGVAVEDLLTHDCVYVPHAGIFVTRDPAPITITEYLEKIAGQTSMLAEVRQRPDQNLQHVCQVIHNPIQDRHNWVPMLISLPCDNRKFLVYREGSIVFNEYNQPDDYPGESDGVHTIAANINQWRLVPTFGSGQSLQVSRQLYGGWLPVPVTTAQDQNITYQQTTYIAPVGEAPSNKPAWLREQALGVAEYLIKNNAAEPSEVRLSFQFKSEQENGKSVQYQECKEGIIAASGNRILALLDKRSMQSLTCKAEPAEIVLSGTLPANSETPCTVYLPAWQVAPDDYTLLLEDTPGISRTENYWRSLLEPAMQVEIPDEFLNNLIKASQVNCLLAARNQERSAYIVPWISSIHFAYPESEANSILRGMDLTGHPDFTRRGLEFYLKESNPAGFITILVHNKVAGISCGYTLVGTGEFLGTLGEHYDRTRDQVWLRKVAPDVVRICRWIIRQREKTKRLDARGQKVPEYGLMPPGVSADWNRFAYRFFNEAQYCHGLEMAGKALADMGDSAAASILEDARQYLQDIRLAYHTMQAKMPVVPLRDGTWVPADPSLLGCYGNVEDFLPGEDVNRTYVYSVELGANHLAANGILDPASADTDWMVGYLEDVQFLRTNWVQDWSIADPFDWGGFAKMQPYYCRIADIHALRDDVKPFIRSYFNVIPALVNFEDLTFWEDMLGNRYAAGAWNKTHETGWFLGQTRTLFIMERGKELWLAPFVTNRWLQDGRKVAIRNAPTRFGPVSYTITSNVANGKIEAVVELPEKCTADKIVLRLRHPEGKPIQAVTVQGKPHSDFDPGKETITIAPIGNAITVRAEY